MSTSTKLRRIAWLSSKDINKKFGNLMHLFNEESLATCYHELDKKKAIGIDGVSKLDYGEKLQDNIQNLVTKMKSMSYKPGNRNDP